METEDVPQADCTQPPRPAQFSLAALFIATAAVAFVFGLVFVIPYWLAGPLMLILIPAIPGMLIVAARCGSAGASAFCIGALMPTGACLLCFAIRTVSSVERLLQPDNYPFSTQSPVPKGTLADPLTPFGKWLTAATEVGVAWRPVIITSWLLAVVVGILCLNTRRFLLRGKPR